MRCSQRHALRNRFHEVLPVLQQQYGGLYNIRCDVLLLW